MECIILPGFEGGVQYSLILHLMLCRSKSSWQGCKRFSVC